MLPLTSVAFELFQRTLDWTVRFLSIRLRADGNGCNALYYHGIKMDYHPNQLHQLSADFHLEEDSE
jgi:hypothetical protein